MITGSDIDLTPPELIREIVGADAERWLIENFYRLKALFGGVPESRATDDLRFPATAINPPGAASDPAWDNSNGGWLFDASSTEVLYLIAQIPHSWREGSLLRPHVHWEKSVTGAGNVRWQLRYEWSAYLEARTALATINESAPMADTDNADTQMITALPDIDASTRQISDILVMRLERTGAHADDTYASDARLLEFDIHYEQDSLGSHQEFIK